MVSQQSEKTQLKRFKKAARNSGAAMTKEEFGRVIGGLVKPKPHAPPQEADSDEEQAVDD